MTITRTGSIPTTDAATLERVGAAIMEELRRQSARIRKKGGPDYGMFFGDLDLAALAAAAASAASPAGTPEVPPDVTENPLRPSRIIMGYEAYTVSFFRHAHDGREGWDARYDGRTQGWFDTEEEGWEALRKLAREYGDLPAESDDVVIYGTDAEGRHTARSPRYRGLIARGSSKGDAAWKLAGMISLVNDPASHIRNARRVSVGPYSLVLPKLGSPIIMESDMGDGEHLSTDAMSALVEFAEEVERLRNLPVAMPSAEGEDPTAYDPSTDPDVGLCDYVRDRVLAWKPTSGTVPPQIAAALPDIAGYAAMGLLMRLREADRDEDKALESPFSGLVPEAMTLPPEAFERLMDAIENPPEPNERLRELMRRKMPWEVDVDKAADTAEGLNP